MSFDLETLYNLLPAVYRIRDLDQVANAPGASQRTGDSSIQLPLKALLQVIAGQIGILEENLAQLYDDQFIETCSPWVIPYIGDLVGYNTPHDTSSQSLRSEVAHTIGYRKRKGTAALVEQLARDVTGWDAHVVEFFQTLAATQRVNRFRSEVNMVDLRKEIPLDRLNTPFDSLAHRVDVRNLADRRGSYNISNIGIFIWRQEAYSLTRTSAMPAAIGNDQHYFFSPLGNNMPLFTHPTVQTDITQLAGPGNVATTISRGELAYFLSEYYGPGKSILLTIDIDGKDRDILPSPDYKLEDLLEIKDLSDWKNLPEQMIAIDPISGRFAFPKDITYLLDRMGVSTTAKVFTNVRSTFYYGFSAEMGGGEYHRSASFTSGLDSYEPVPADAGAIQQALDAFTVPSGPGKSPSGAAVEITDSGRIEGVLSIAAAANQRIELRAADFYRPLLELEDKTKPPEMLISGEAGSWVTLNGLVISHGSLRVSGNLERLTLRHCTLVPGLSLSEVGKPQYPPKPSLIVESLYTLVEIDHSIVGSLHIIESATVNISNSIVDATEKHHIAYAGTAVSKDGVRSHGGALRVENSTIIGKCHTVSMELASNTIFLAQGGVPVDVMKRQEGCVRFSFVPDDSRTPRRYNCQPAEEGQAKQVEPHFTSSRYGTPGYCQLLQRAPVKTRQEANTGNPTQPESAYDTQVRKQAENDAKIRQGADDQAEIGAFHDLFQPQRETNLRLRLAEYLRFTLEPGIIYVT